MTTVAASPAQNVSSINPVVARYAKYGAWQGPKVRTASEIFMMLLSTPGKGKSTFLESNPRLMRIDLDRAGSSHTNPVCVTLPDPKDATWSWPSFVRIVDQLVDDASKKLADRPACVAIDTLDSLMALCIADIAPEMLAANEGVKYFSALDARKAYPPVYDRITQQLHRLRMAGYGVILCSHIHEARVPAADGSVATKWDLSLTDGLWARLNGQLDMVAVLDDVDSTETVKNEAGKAVGTRKVSYKALFCASGSPKAPREYGAYLKKRASAPQEVMISKDTGWADFETAYTKAQFGT